MCVCVVGFTLIHSNTHTLIHTQAHWSICIHIHKKPKNEFRKLIIILIIKNNLSLKIYPPLFLLLIHLKTLVGLICRNIVLKISCNILGVSIVRKTLE